MEKKTLTPRNVIKIKGKLSYSESLGAWNTLRFRREIVREFPQLEEKRSKFSYELLHFRDMKELQETLKKLKEEDGFPLILRLFKEE